MLILKYYYQHNLIQGSFLSMPYVVFATENANAESILAEHGMTQLIRSDDFTTQSVLDTALFKGVYNQFIEKT